MFFTNHSFAKIVIAAILLIISVETSKAATLPLRLSWNRNTETDLAFYSLYYGTSSRNYSNFITINKQYNTFLLDQSRLSVGRTYYFALTATDLLLNESGYSQELVVRIDASATTTTTGSAATTTMVPFDSSSVIEAEFMSSSTGGRAGDYWQLWANGIIKQEINFPAGGTHRFEIIAKATLAYNIGAEMKLIIDGETRGSVFVNSTTAQTYTFNIEVSQGTHEIAIGFYNDYYDSSAGIDRNLYVDKIIITFAGGESVYRNIIEAENMSYHANGSQSGDFWLLWANGTMQEGLYFPDSGTYSFEIIAKATLINNIGAEMELIVDGVNRGNVFVNDTAPQIYPFNTELSQGTHEIAIGFCNDYYDSSSGTDRNLYVDKMIISFAGVSTTTSSVSDTATTTIPLSSTTTVPVDTTPPDATIKINEGNETTNSRQVMLNFSVQDLMSGMGEGAQMMMSNDNEHWYGPKPFNRTTAWVLTPGEGLKTVYAKFCDAAGNWMTDPASDTIEFQLTCPETAKLEPISTDCSENYLKLWSHEKAVDGNDATGWLSRMRRAIQEDYIILDLGAAKVINRIDITSKRFIGRDLFPRDFKVQASVDMQNWTEVIAEQDYTLPSSRSGSWTFDGTEARYVKLVATRPQKYLLFYYMTYISEIEVYGCSEPEVPEPESLASARTADEARSLLSQEAFEREFAGKKGSLIEEGVAPGRPGKPIFILEGDK